MAKKLDDTLTRAERDARLRAEMAAIIAHLDAGHRVAYRACPCWTPPAIPAPPTPA